MAHKKKKVKKKSSLDSAEIQLRKKLKGEASVSRRPAKGFTPAQEEAIRKMRKQLKGIRRKKR